MSNLWTKNCWGDCDVQPGLQSLLHFVSHHIILILGKGILGSEKVRHAELTLSTTCLVSSTLSDTLISRTQG